MSKASEWANRDAATNALWRALAYEDRGRSARRGDASAKVSATPEVHGTYGLCVSIKTPHCGSTHPELLLEAREALDLARWIIDTFGEER